MSNLLYYIPRRMGVGGRKDKLVNFDCSQKALAAGNQS